MEQSSQTVPARRQSRPWTEEDQRQASQLQAQGMSLRRIAKVMKRDQNTIYCRLNPQARIKANEAARQWRKANPEKHREFSARYRKANPEKEYLRKRRYFDENREKIRENARRRHSENPEKGREKARRRFVASSEHIRLRARLNYQANREAILDKKRAWAKANADKVCEYSRRRHALHRASFKASLSPLTSEQREKRFGLYGNVCAYCHASGRLSVDHVLPLFQGGLDQADNIVPACGRCNSSKGARHVEEWYRRQPFFTEERWRKIQRHCPAAVAGQLPLALAA